MVISKGHVLRAVTSLQLLKKENKKEKEKLPKVLLEGSKGHFMILVNRQGEKLFFSS